MRYQCHRLIDFFLPLQLSNSISTGTTSLQFSKIVLRPFFTVITKFTVDIDTFSEISSQLRRRTARRDWFLRRKIRQMINARQNDCVQISSMLPLDWLRAIRRRRKLEAMLKCYDSELGPSHGLVWSADSSGWIRNGLGDCLYTDRSGSYFS